MWPVALSGRLPVEALVGRCPANKLIGRDPIPCRRSLPTPPCDDAEHRALPSVSRSYSRARGRSVTHYSPVRRSHPEPKPRDPARLACVKHAASARPEPESNSPPKSGEPENRPQKRKTDHPPRGTERTKRIRRPASRPPHWHQKTILSDTINALEFSSHQPDRQPATRPATRRQQEKTIHHTHQNTTPHHTHHTTTQANTTKTPACRKQETPACRTLSQVSSLYSAPLYFVCMSPS